MIGSTRVAIMAGVGVLSLVVVLAAINPLLDATNLEEHSTHALQVDINEKFRAFGDPGFFKLLADFTHKQVVEGHVAISNVQCDEDGNSPFVIVLANANVGAGNSNLAIIGLNDNNLVHDVSFPDKYCTYHIDIEDEIVNNNISFPITDIALANSDDRTKTPKDTASATLFVEVAEIEDNDVE